MYPEEIRTISALSRKYLGKIKANIKIRGEIWYTQLTRIQSECKWKGREMVFEIVVHLCGGKKKKKVATGTKILVGSQIKTCYMNWQEVSVVKEVLF